MNITNFIVEVLRKGQQVEVPGIGTFSLQTVDAYHDEQSGVLYPKRESVSFSMSTTGNVDIIDAIAKSECVSQETAKMMWNSFVSAVDERLRTTGSHSFKGLGTLVRCADGYAFQPEPSLNFAEDAAKPLHDINVYNHADEEDPFAAFEQPLHPIEPEVIVTAPVDVPLDKFEPTQEETPAPAEEQQTETHSEPVEPSPIKVAPIIPDDFYKPMEPVDEVEAADDEPQQESEQENATESNTEGSETSSDEMNIFKGIPDSDGKSNPIDSMEVDSDKPKKRKKHTWLWIILAVLLLLAGIASYFYFVYRPNNGGTMDTAMAALKKDIASIRGEGSEIAIGDDEDMDAEEAGSDVSDVNGITAGGESTGEGGAGGGIGEGVEGGIGTGGVASSEEGEAVATQETQPTAETSETKSENTAVQETAEAQKPEEAAQENNESTAEDEGKTAEGKAADAPFDFNRHVSLTTFDIDLVELDASDVEASTSEVHKIMANYINEFLASRRYTNSRQQMMQRVDQYSKQRLEELFSPHIYTPMRFLPSGSDYVRDYCYDFLKMRRKSRGVSQVVKELLDNSTLEKILDELVSELGLQADPLPVPPTPPVTFKKMAEPTASFETKSRRGYDIVAGFYTNKNSANRMASILKRQGCDAYIINHNGLYYVSMGSAPTQTAAESLYKHIKSWYDGDVAIRKL